MENSYFYNKIKDKTYLIGRWYTQEATDLIYEIRNKLEPIYKKAIEENRNLRELAYLINSASEEIMLDHYISDQGKIND